MNKEQYITILYFFKSCCMVIDKFFHFIMVYSSDGFDICQYRIEINFFKSIFVVLTVYYYYYHHQ